MPSILHQQFAEQARPLLAEQAGIAVKHHPGGLPDEETDVETEGCLWIEQAPERDESRGQEVIRKGKLTVPDSVSVTTADAWTVPAGDDGELWQTDTLGPLVGGARRINLVRTDIEERGRGGRTGLK